MVVCFLYVCQKLIFKHKCYEESATVIICCYILICLFSAKCKWFNI
nr:MAG TPA: hypothetical protein [Caudoviricetes sp.]